jgi:hypothetical protein
LLKRQSYTVRRVIESGEHVAVEVKWNGVLAVPVMNLTAGSAMKAFVAMFFTLREGRLCGKGTTIVTHRLESRQMRSWGRDCAPMASGIKRGLFN